MSLGVGAIVAMAIGIVGSSAVHLSKGVMKLGISGLGAGGASGGASGGAATPAVAVAIAAARRRSRVIYALGIALNFTTPLWVIVANRFAPTVYYTSMYGLGLGALLVYSRLRLHEHIAPRQLLGVLLIVSGTLVIGVSELTQDVPSLYDASRSRLFIVAGLWILLTPLAAVLMRGGRPAIQEILFGVAGGGLAALDAIAKGVAQSGEAGNTFLPTTGANWVLFVLSFIGAAGAFGMIQWSYLRSCRASMMSATYDLAYVAVPLLLVPFILGTPMVGPWCIVGIALLGIGAALTAGGEYVRTSR